MPKPGIPAFKFGLESRLMPTWACRAKDLPWGEGLGLATLVPSYRAQTSQACTSSEAMLPTLPNPEPRCALPITGRSMLAVQEPPSPPWYPRRSNPLLSIYSNSAPGCTSPGDRGCKSLGAALMFPASTFAKDSALQALSYSAILLPLEGDMKPLSSSLPCPWALFLPQASENLSCREEAVEAWGLGPSSPEVTGSFSPHLQSL